MKYFKTCYSDQILMLVNDIAENSQRRQIQSILSVKPKIYYRGFEILFYETNLTARYRLGLRKVWICNERPITICPIVTCWPHARTTR